MPRHDYEERQESRRERLEERADNLTSKARDAFQQADAATAGIPFGQPILVGHHSERRHRKALERSDNAMRKGCDALDYAKSLARRADAVGTGGISSDDPEAVTKLREKIAKIEVRRTRQKLANKAWREARKKPAVLETGGKYASELSEEMLAKLRTWTPPYAFVKVPFDTSHDSAEIRRCKERIELLLRENAMEEAKPYTLGSCTVEESKAQNRIFLVFPGKPSEAVREIVKRYGFRWSRAQGVWSRMLNNPGRNSARWVAEAIVKLEEAS